MAIEKGRIQLGRNLRAQNCSQYSRVQYGYVTVMSSMWIMLNFVGQINSILFLQNTAVKP